MSSSGTLFDKAMIGGCHCRSLVFCVLLLVSFYAATRRNCFRYILINFWADVNRIASGNNTDLQPPCSFSVFREHLRETSSNYLHGYGAWKRRAGRLERFHPELCSLSYGSRLPRDRLARCFARMNISYVAVLGDSNALRLYREVRRSLSAVGTLRILTCDDVRHDSDVMRPTLPARRCSPNYISLRRFLPPNYFRCKITYVQRPVAPLLVQYLPVTGDLLPLRSLLNSTATGCVDSKTNKFIRTQASTVQVSNLP